MRSETARIAADHALLVGDLALPEQPGQPIGVVAFAHGSGSSRHSPRTLAVPTGLG